MCQFTASFGHSDAGSAGKLVFVEALIVAFDLIEATVGLARAVGSTDESFGTADDTLAVFLDIAVDALSAATIVVDSAGRHLPFGSEKVGTVAKHEVGRDASGEGVEFEVVQCPSTGIDDGKLDLEVSV